MTLPPLDKIKDFIKSVGLVGTLALGVTGYIVFDHYVLRKNPSWASEIPAIRADVAEVKSEVHGTSAINEDMLKVLQGIRDELSEGNDFSLENCVLLSRVIEDTDTRCKSIKRR